MRECWLSLETQRTQVSPEGTRRVDAGGVQTARSRIIGDSWYSTAIPGVCDSLDAVLERRCYRWIHNLSQRPGLLRSILLFSFGRDYDLMFTALRLKGTWLVILLEAIFGRGRRRLVLLEFTPAPLKGTWYRRLRCLHEVLVLRYAVRWSVRKGQVLTRWERLNYAKRFNLPESRLEYVPWPQRRETDQPPDFDRQRSPVVVSSGRMGCDWSTLFKAALGRPWKLTAICGQPDLELVTSSAQNSGATVLCNVPLDEHQRILRASAVYVLSTFEDFISVGQIRVMNAIRAGIPIVATRVIGIEGYLIDGENALLVAPGDHLAMRHAIERLLAEPETRTRIAKRAFELAQDRTFERYLAELGYLIRNASTPGCGMVVTRLVRN